MKTRQEAVAYARRLFIFGWSDPPIEQIVPVKEKSAYHWGKCEIGALMDFIYGGEPQSKDEEIWPAKNLRNR